MLRLTTLSQNGEEAVLKVEGWVAGEEVALLEEELSRQLHGGRRLVLDLKGVRFIDQAGLEVLARWSGGQLVLRGGSDFIQELLKAHGLSPTGQGTVPSKPER